jgi:NADH-quinone oxidoreductase subunit G
VTAPDQVTCTIDGVEVAVPKGTAIIRAAEEVGIMIPRFCDHPLLQPVAACRQCLVDVASPAGPEGKLRAFPKPQPACAMTVTPGMVVSTQVTSPAAKEAQEQVAELILINHPLDCPVCDKGGECPLQNQAMATGRAASRFTEPKNTFRKPLALTPQILLDRERCVLCQRCTRFAMQIPGDPFIALQMRGANQQIGRFDPATLGFAVPPDELADQSLSDPVTPDGEPFAGYFAGNIIQICPVGALTSAAYRFRARPFDLVSTESVAEHDANGSTIRVDYRRGTVLRRLSGNDPVVNQEWISDKDRFGFRWQTASDRLTTPLLRRGGELVPASWSAALAAAAEALGQAAAVGVLPGGRLTLEDALAYEQFTRRVLKSGNVDFRARPANGEEAAFLAHQVAGTGLGVTFEELVNAPAVLFAGFDPEDEGGILYLRLRAAKTPVRALAPFTSRAIRRLGGTVHQVAPGQEAAFLDKMAQDPATEATAGTVIVVGQRLVHSPGGFSAALAAAKKHDAKLVWIPRRAGERAALEAGLLPGLLPGGRFDQAGSAGLDVNQMIEAAAAGKLDALVLGGLEVSDLPDPELAAKAFGKAKVVALNVRREEVSPYADVVLPVAPPQEKAGTYINWEGRPRPFPQVLKSAGLSDAAVLRALAAKLGFELTLAEPGQGQSALADLADLAEPSVRCPAPKQAPGPAPVLAEDEVLLSTWHQLVDDAAGLADEPRLAASAPAPVVRLAPDTAAGLGLTQGELVSVATSRGRIVLPSVIDPDMLEGVVHLPAKSPGSWVLSSLGAASGAVVKLALAASGTEEGEK